MTRYTPYHTPPTRQSDTTPDMYEQAARASWAAPLIAFVIGLCMTTGSLSGMHVVLVRLIMDLILIGGGLVAGVYALTGVRKRGPERVLAPAIVGLILNGLIVLATLALIASGGFTSKKPLPPALRGMSMQQIGEQSFKQAGWFGAIQHNGATVTAVSLDASTPMAQIIATETPNVAHMVLFAIDNSTGAAAMKVNCSSARIILPGGQRINAMTTAPAGDKGLKDGLLRFSGVRTLPVGQRLTDGIAFFSTVPPSANYASIILDIDNKPVEITGRFMTEQEKSAAAGR